MNKTVMIVDSFSLLYKAFFGVRPMKSSDGTPTNAIYGFTNMLLKLVKDYHPEYLFAAFDAGKITFRTQAYEAYKAGREDMPEDLRAQVPIVFNLLTESNVSILQMENYEADDIVGFVSHAAKDQGYETIIVTGDRDSFQLANDNTHVLYAKKGVSDTVWADRDYILNTYQVEPKQLIDVKALMGDKSDNIPGVAGVGEKTALNLIQSYHSLDGVYEHIDEIKGKLQEKLINDKEKAYLSRDLATICTEVPVDFHLTGEYGYDFTADGFVQQLKNLEMNSLLKSLSITEDKSKNCETAYVTENHIPLHRYQSKTVSVIFASEKISEKNSVAISDGTDHIVYQAIDLQTAKDFAEDESIQKIVHNFKDIYKSMILAGIEPKGFVFDTFLAGYVLNPSDERYELDILSKKYLQKEIGKKQQTVKQQTFFDDANESEEDCRLLADQTFVNYELYKLFNEKLEKEQMMGLYRDIEHQLMFVLGDMEIEGFKVDLDMLKELEKNFDSRTDELTQRILEITNKTNDFNLASPKQLGVLLFEELNLPVIKKTKTGYSTDIEVLEKLADKHPVIPLLIELRKLTKINSTYIKGFMKIIDPRTHRIHSTFNQTVTTTGRISSSSPNLQNIPIKTEEGKVIRKIFIPSSSDNLLIDADYSQIELRLLAHISGDENMIEAFRNNEDIHTRTASEVFDIPIDQVTSMQRSSAKAVNFGIVYGISDFGLSRNLNIKRSDAKDYIEKYLDSFPGVRQYMSDIIEEVRKTGYAQTMFGRRRYLPDINSTNFTIRSFGERTALNTPIQGSAADIIKIAMVRVSKRLKESQLKAKLILQIHDELIIDCPKTEVDQAEKILKYEMEHAAQLRVPLVADLKSADNWYDAK